MPEERPPQPAWLAPASAALVALAVLALGAMPVRDLDTWWHLATGRLVFASGIPRGDPFSFVLEGRPWVSFEWLAEALFWAAWRAGGAPALILIKGLVAAGGYLLAWRAGRGRPLWSALLCALGAACARRWLVERPFVFDLLGVGLAALLVGERPADGPGRRAWLLVPLAAVWSSLHGAAALAAGGMALAAAIQARWREPRTPLSAWAGVAAAAAFAVLLNPHGSGVLAVAARTAFYPGKELLYEWNPPGRDLLGPLGVWALAGGWAAWRAWRAGSPWAVWTAAALAGTLWARRSEPLFLLCAPACAAAVLEPPEPRLWAGLRPGARLAGVALAAAAAFVGAVSLSPQGWRGVGLSGDPELAGAAAFLDREGIGGRLFNEYESGGPLIFHAAGRRKVFIDGRNAEYPPELFEDALHWYQPDAWARLDARWGFAGAVVRRHPTGAWTTRVLDEAPNWRLVYWDDEALVYLKDVPENSERIARLGLRLVQPGRGNDQWADDALRRGGGGELLAELEAVLDRAPRCVSARLLMAYVLVRLERPREAVDRAREAAALAPGEPQPLFTLGWTLEAVGDAPGAEQAYRAALAGVRREARAGVGADILNDLGRLAERRGDRKAAAELYRKAVSWNRRQGHAMANLRRLEGF